MRAWTWLSTVAILGVGMAGCLQDADTQAPVRIAILSISDWHGQLDPINGIGGAAVLSSFFAQERQTNPLALTFTAGDSVGATPPLSSLFADEPAIRAMNLMGFTADTLGNHNFDAGLGRLHRHSELADFPFLAANLAGTSSELPLIRPWRIFDVGGIQVGVVGLVNEEAPTITKAGAFGQLRVTDAAEAATEARHEMEAAGADVFVVLTHKGVNSEGRGALVDLARNLTGFHIILGDHTNVAFEDRINGALVVENPSKGTRYARITITISPSDGAVTSVADYVVPKASDVEHDTRITQMLAPYREQIAPSMDRKIAAATSEISREPGSAARQDPPMGNLVADAMRAAVGTQVAFTNHGGTRSGLPTSYVPQDQTLRRDSAPFDIVQGDVFVVAPFGNALVTGRVTGAALWQALEQGLNRTVPEISGIRLVYDSTRPAGSRIVSVSLDGPPPLCPTSHAACDAVPRGQPIRPDATLYSIVTTDFVAGGGDGFDMFRDLGAPGELVTDVLTRHLESVGTIEPLQDGRVLDLARVH